MKIERKAKKEGVGFLDPHLVSRKLNNFNKECIHIYVIKALEEQHFSIFIILPYYEN